MKYLHLSVAALLIAGLGGCEILGDTASDETSVSFTLDKTVYAVEEPVVLTLENRTFQRVGFNLSCSVLEPQEGQQLPIEVRETVCAQYLGILTAHSETQLSYPLHRDLQAGSYRFSTRIYVGRDQGEMQMLLSPVFEVSR